VPLPIFGEEPAPHRLGAGLGACASAELPENRRHVVVHGLRREKQPLRDVRVGPADRRQRVAQRLKLTRALEKTALAVLPTP
jgi:hypothetical protein